MFAGAFFFIDITLLKSLGINDITWFHFQQVSFELAESR
jgi:hypothetical protein